MASSSMSGASLEVVAGAGGEGSGIGAGAGAGTVTVGAESLWRLSPIAANPTPAATIAMVHAAAALSIFPIAKSPICRIINYRAHPRGI